jgi:dynein heavy chain
LVNNCVIDWFTKWPEQALYSVATAFLGEEAGIPEEHRQVELPHFTKLTSFKDIIKYVVYCHLSVTTFSEQYEQELQRHNYVTPKNFLDFINKYIELLRQNKKRIVDAHKRFDGGLKVLS